MWGAEGLRLFGFYALTTAIPIKNHQWYKIASPLNLPRVLSVTRSATTGRLPLTLAGASTRTGPALYHSIRTAGYALNC
jgi:hypothetical protein